jgi:hypothetical protein
VKKQAEHPRANAAWVAGPSRIFFESARTRVLAILLPFASYSPYTFMQKVTAVRSNYAAKRKSHLSSFSNANTSNPQLGRD